MIDGLTNNKPRIGRARKIKVGEKDPNRGFPRKLDHFKSSDPKFHEVHGKKPTRLSCYLPSLDIDTVWQTALAAYKGAGLWCKGDGVTANRRAPDGGWMQVDCANCPHHFRDGADRDKKVCKPLGTLNVIDRALPGADATQIRTTSINSILNIGAKLEQARGLRSLQLWEVPFVLSVSMERISYANGSKTTTAPILHLDFEDSIDDLVAKALAAEQRVLPEPVAPRAIAAPGVTPESIDAEPTPELLYPDAIDVTPEPTVDELLEMEKVAVRGKAEILGKGVIYTGWVEKARVGGLPDAKIRRLLLQSMQTVGINTEEWLR
jgi:hypothetical protein